MKYRSTRRAVTTAVGSALLLAACGTSAGEQNADQQVAAGDPVAGQLAFQNSCAQCHGQELQGTGQGPSFLDPVYEPNHHGDAAFRIAPLRGVQQHHWQFGDMPPVEGITEQEIEDIIAYVRQVQRENGIG